MQGEQASGKNPAPTPSGILRSSELSREAALHVYELVFQHAAFALAIVDSKRRLIQFANPAFAKLHGCELEEILGRPLQKFIAPESHAKWEKACAIIAQTGRHVFELWHCRCHGENFPCAIEMNVVRDPQGIPLHWFASFRDVSEQRRAEAAVQESEERYRSLFENNIDAIFSLDVYGRFLSVNPAAEKVSGYAAEEFKTKTIADLVASEYLPIAFEAFEADLRGDHRQIEVDIIRKDGARVPMFITGAPMLSGGKIVGVFGIAREITERKRAQEQLAADLDAMTRLQKLSTLFMREGDLAPVLGEILEAAIAICGADFGNIQLLDAASGTLQIVAQRGFDPWWLEFWNAAAQSHGTCGVALEKGERVIVEDVEQSPIFAGTAALDIQLRAGVRAVQSTPLISRSGKPIGMFSTHYKKPCRPDGRALRLLDVLARQAADIIERAQAEKALREANDSLEQRVRERTAELEAANRELEAFSYSVSHDLRAPLRSILGFSRAVLQDCGERVGEEGRALLKRIDKSAERMSQLIDDLLHLARIGRHPMRSTRVDLAAMARAIVEDLRAAHPSRPVDFSAPENAWACGDAGLLRVALSNLLDNAWKFTSRTERAKIEFGCAEQKPGRAIYFVKDNGAGFEMRHAENLFAPFQRLHAREEFPGEGIGLATVQRIVARHGGRAWAEATPNRGATFFFELRWQQAL